MSERRPLPTTEEAALAGMLHDIGKFMQRALGSVDTLSEEVRNRASIVLPTYEGRSSHWHALWSDAFFSAFVDKNPFPEGVDRRWVRDLAVFHHRPQGNGEGGIANSATTWLITEADRIASGMERKKRDEEEEAGTSSGGRDAYRKTLLDSMFGIVKINAAPTPQNLRQKLARLAPENLDPVTGDRLDPAMPAEYKRLWDEFIGDYSNLAAFSHGDVVAFHAGLLSLLETYTWAIPSSTMDQPDVGLYDHARAVAAIAACLHRHHEHAGTLADETALRNRQTAKFQFVLGDLSGIQTTLFRLASEGASGLAKVLRGRSLRFQLIAESVAQMALKTLGLPACCLLQNAGGRFMILAPVMEPNRQRADFDALRADVDQWMRGQYLGELSLNLALAGPFSGNDLMQQDCFGALMQTVGLAAEEAKLRPLEGARAPLGEAIQGEFGLCPTCGARPVAQGTGQGPFLCRACEAETRLGAAFPKAMAVVLDGHGIPRKLDCIGDLNVDLPSAPYDKRPGRGWRLAGGNLRDGLPAAGRLSNTYVPRHSAATLARPDFIKARQNANDTDEPKIGDVITFAELAAASVEGGKGRPMLAALKADVDRLGQIFSRGLGEKRSLARIAALSRMMDAFFTGHLPARLEKDFPLIYTVYAGGDDLLLLGPWRDILRFAEVLNKDFAAFVGHSKHVTISTGLALFDAKTPISRAADEAEARLEKAKAQGRDRICLITNLDLAKALTWPQFSEAMQKAEYLHGLLNDQASGVTTSLLYKMLWFDDRRLQANAGHMEAHDWIAKLGYHLHRALGDKKQADTRASLLALMGLRPDMKPFDSVEAPAARIALSIALYRNR